MALQRMSAARMDSVPERHLAAKQLQEEVENLLSANRDGMLLLIEELIKLCAHNKNWSHYHLDEAGMADKCNKPMVISLVRED